LYLNAYNAYQSIIKSMPFGNIEAPVNPISLALAAGARFVARGFGAEQKHLTELIKQHPAQGFLIPGCLQPVRHIITTTTRTNGSARA
jgi:hypothetical protein